VEQVALLALLIFAAAILYSSVAGCQTLRFAQINMNTIPATAPSTTPTMAANRESVNATASKPPNVEPSNITTKATILLVLNDTRSLLTFAYSFRLLTESEHPTPPAPLLRPSFAMTARGTGPGLCSLRLSFAIGRLGRSSRL
jgi:hypothetical protein